MRKISGAFVGVGLSAGLVFGTAACGDKEISAEQRDAEIQRLAGELELARVALSSGQVQYNAHLELLPDDCEKVVKPYLPPEGSLSRTELDIAVSETAEWCAPDNLDAVAVLRGMYGGLNSLQSQVDGLEFSVAANLAAAGVEPSAKNR